MTVSKGRIANRYTRLLEHIFKSRYTRGAAVVEFSREDIEQAAKRLKLKLPKNLGDVVYSFRYRTDLPKSIRGKAPSGKVWIIRGVKRSRYAFAAIDPKSAAIAPQQALAETKIPDGTPGIVAMYALNDEQALLAILRYNRLIDVFTGVSCYSLQNHLRTTAAGSQVETDEVYVGLDKRGAHYVFPVQAKGGRDRISVVQIEQDFAMCATKFANAICRPVAAQFIEKDLIALFEFERTENGVTIANERHYRLTAPEEIGVEEIRGYARRPE
jgi:hypothetical protein